MATDTSGRVYISYARRDEDLAAALAERLEQDGFNPWTPDRELYPGDNRALMAGQALDQADAMVVIVTPEGLENDRLDRDFQYALANARFRGGRLVPMLARGATEEHLPWSLRRFGYVMSTADIADACARVSHALHEALHGVLA